MHPAKDVVTNEYCMDNGKRHKAVLGRDFSLEEYDVINYHKYVDSQIQQRTNLIDKMRTK